VTLRKILPLLLMTSLALAASSDDMPVHSLTLDDFVEKAIKVGIQGKENELSVESAGYTREIAFRQTDSPTFTLNHTSARGETTTSGLPALSNSQQTNMSMNETTPIGTTLNAVGQWANSGGTLGPAGTVAQPGFTANVTQPLYIFVKNAVRRTRQTAELNFASAKDTFDAAVLSIRTQARSLYYNVMLDDESIDVAARKAASSRKLLEVTQALVDAGKSAPVDAMRAKLTLQEDERQLNNAVVIRDQAVLNAKNYILWPLDQPVHFTTRLQFKAFDKNVDRLVAFAMIHNPTLHSLQRQQDLAQLSYEASVEPTRPTFALNGTYGDSQINYPFTVTHDWSWTGTINWLFFDSFVTRDQARTALIARWVADLNVKNAEWTTEVNVRNAYMDVKRTEKQIVDFRASREQAQRNVEIVRLRFRNGLDRLIDVFDAETQMHDLDTEYLGLLVTYNQSKDTLSQMIGADVETVQ